MAGRYDFASDNVAGAMPEVIEALIAANAGVASGYGTDHVSARAADLIRAALDADAEVRFVASGTAANALALAGYSDTQIQKRGRWKGATFKEYSREELHVFSEGMSKNMKHTFRFVNISGGVYHDVTSDTIASEYNTLAAAA